MLGITNSNAKWSIDESKSVPVNDAIDEFGPRLVLSHLSRNLMRCQDPSAHWLDTTQSAARSNELDTWTSVEFGHESQVASIFLSVIIRGACEVMHCGR